MGLSTWVRLGLFLVPSVLGGCGTTRPCSLLQGDASISNYQNFVDICLDVNIAVSGGQCSTCASPYFGNINSRGTQWTAPCCDPRGFPFNVCCIDPGVPCQTFINDVYESNCFGETIACPGNKQLVIGTKADFEAFFERDISQPYLLPTPSQTPTQSATKSASSSQSATSTASSSQSATSSATQTATTSPTQTSTQSVTRSASQTSTSSASKTQTATSSPTQSPSSSQTAEPTSSPSASLSKFANFLQNLTTFEMSGNLKSVASYQDSFPRQVETGNLLLWNDLDATVTIECGATVSGSDCEYVLRSSVRILRPLGFTAVRVWAVFTDDGSEKILLEDRSFLWSSPNCTFQGGDCPELPLTSGPTSTQQNLAYFEFRLGITTLRDTNAPLLIEWFDETLVAHGMRPEINGTLIVYRPYNLTVGEDFSFEKVFTGKDTKTAMVILTLFVVVLLIIMIVSCVRKRKMHYKRRYVLNTDGFRTITKGGKTQIKKSQTLDRNRFKYQHVPFVLIILLWRIAYSLLFTLTFFYLMFRSINNPHFSTLRQWDGFSDDRDGQLKHVMATIEVAFNQEADRITGEFSTTQEKCNITAELESAYVIEEDEIRQFHDSEIEKRKSLSLQPGTTIVTLSSSQVCNTAPPAVFQKNAITTATRRVVNGTTTTFVTVTLSLATATIPEAREKLSSACQNSSFCVGYGFDNVTKDYFLFQTFGAPKVDESSAHPGFCFGVSVSTAVLPGENLDERNAQLRAEYESSVNSTFAQFNSIMGALDAGFQGLDVVIDRTPGARSFGFQDLAFSFKGSLNTGSSFDTGAVFACPGCPTEFVAPPLTQLSTSNATTNNQTFSTNLTSDVNVTNFYFNRTLNGSLLQFTEPDFSFLERPKFDWQFYSFKNYVGVVSLVVGLDGLMFAYRTTMTVAIVIKYVRGIDKHIPATLLGKRMDVKWLIEYATCTLLFGCIQWLGKKLRHLDSTLWVIFGKILFAMQVCVLFLLILIAYWVVDNAIQLETFEQFGVFEAMTAAPSAQRTLRNEQLVAKAFALNEAGAATFQIAIERKSRELRARQQTFNENEFIKVRDFNDQYCSSLAAIVSEPFHLDVAAQVPDCCPKPITQRDFVFGVDASQPDGVSNYVIDTVEFDLTLHVRTGTIAASPNCLTDAELKPVRDVGPLGFTVSLFTTINGTDELTFTTGRQVFNAITPSAGPCVGIASNDNLDRKFLKNTTQTLSFSPSNFVQSKASKISIQFDNPTFDDVFKFYSLDEFSAIGHVASTDAVECDKVEFRELNFQPNDHLGDCASIKPVSAEMMRIFERDDWTDKLRAAHIPFIAAVRNIALSPFYLLLVAVSVYIIIFTFLTLLEYCMVKADLIRVNALAKVPCVIAKESVRMSQLETTSRRSTMMRNSLEPRKRSIPKSLAPSTRPTEIELHRVRSTQQLLSTPNKEDSPDADHGTPPENPLHVDASPSTTPLTTPWEDRLEDDSIVTVAEWVPVEAADGRVYYYNPKTEQTSWKNPDE